MRYFNLGRWYNVTLFRREVQEFKRRWPCSGLPDKPITFQFDKQTGDLVDIWPDSSKFDGPALTALSHDAQDYANTMKG